MGRLRRALVRGRQSSFWRIKDDVLILTGLRPGEETDVPVPHLANEVEFERHIQRLREKRWVDRKAIDELIEIRNGAAR